MDIYLNLKAFQTTAEYGNFSRAARELGLAASVVTKRVNQLEQQLAVKLFHRSTRALELTEAGRRHLEHARSLTAQLDELLSTNRNPSRPIEDFVRIKAPTTLTVLHLNKVFCEYAQEFPRVRLEVVLVDRPTDPISEGFDLAIGAFPHTFEDAIDVPLCRLRRLLCAAPSYLARHGMPEHPRELVKHNCLCFLPTGNNWVFETRMGPITVIVTPQFCSNDGQVLVDAATNGNGIAIVSNYAAQQALTTGGLVPVLEDYPLQEMWFKAVAPMRRAKEPAVSALLERLQKTLAPVPPWEVGEITT